MADRLISAEKLKEAIQKNICEMSCDEPRGCSYCRASDVWDVIYEQPTVDAEPVRHGRWVNHISEDGATDGTYCGICDYEVDRDARYNYCPNCGAKMDGGDS